MYEKSIKRGLDLTGATMLLILTSPLFVVLAVVIKLESPGSVFYRQLRTGRYGKDFVCFKFRSTPPDNSVHDKTKADVFTQSGKFMRRYSLDELPQLIHVIKGDMSFIGPRPWIPDYYSHMNNEQRRRNDVRPGITGLAQAYGRNSLTIHQKIAYDLRYVDHIGPYEDLKVIFITLKTLLDKEAANMGKGGIHEELDVLRRQFEAHSEAERSGKFTNKEGQEATL